MCAERALQNRPSEKNEWLRGKAVKTKKKTKSLLEPGGKIRLEPQKEKSELNRSRKGGEININEIRIW